jgi:hypothetical protein
VWEKGPLCKKMFFSLPAIMLFTYKILIRELVLLFGFFSEAANKYTQHLGICLLSCAHNMYTRPRNTSSKLARAFHDIHKLIEPQAYLAALSSIAASSSIPSSAAEAVVLALCGFVVTPSSDLAKKKKERNLH